MKKLSVKDLSVKDKKVFVRVDFNVPMDETGKIKSDVRIRSALPTIEYIVKNKGIAILGSHLGKPKGKKDAKYSLRPVAQRLSELLKKPVLFAEDCVGETAEKVIREAEPGDVILLENLRFYAEEEKNDPNFARELARLADLYVNDAFGTAHRAHASTEGMAKLFPTPAAGFLMEKEISYLSRVLESPKSPFIAVIGGAKISDKLAVIKNLLTKVSDVLLGGGLIFNFYKAKGYEIGKSIFEPELLKAAKNLSQEKKIYLPEDVVIADRTDGQGRIEVVAPDKIPTNYIGLDIGPKTITRYKEILHTAKTIVWAGPMGMFEVFEFAQGTKAIALAIAQATENGATSVVGGGDTLSALEKFGLTNKVSHASTGGGACLEFLEGKILPGIAVLKDRQ
uniref:Phosphoglycerate kinase n=1 Tax=candidate division WOR-3 bacterium TaxID=2052148 RepID=A0A7C6A9S0_UNCW3